ncbi:MAG TPA: HEAT repeat domain-containing protein, partial [Erythrobacter sp.]|nr:HEAT repeat domain-containing protein [Erythrobacter sp.]
GAGDRRLNYHSSYANPQPALVPTLTPPQVMQLVCDVGGTPVDYFSWAGPEMGSTLDQARPHLAAGFAALVAAQPEAFAAAFGHLPNETLVLRLLDRAQRCDALKHAPVVAQIVALMGKGNPKAVREGAVYALARMEPSALLAVITQGFQDGDIETRHGLVQIASQAGTPEILAVLEARAKVEKAAKVQAAIAAILEIKAESIDSPHLPNDGQGESASASYVAITGESITLPPRCDLGSEAIPAPSDAVCIGFFDLIPKIEAFRRQRTEDYNQRLNRTGSNVSPMPTPFTQEEIEAAFATLTSAAPMPQNAPGAGTIHRAEMLVRDVRGTPEGQKWLREALAPLSVSASLSILTASNPGDVRSVLGLGFANYPHEMFGLDILREWLTAGQIDLRDLASAAELRQVLARGQNSYTRDRAMDAIAALPDTAVWPWLAENLEVFDEALGLRAATTPIPLDRAMTVLAMLPAAPQRYLPRLTEIAVAEKRPLRLQAMALLREAKDLPKRIEVLLDDKRQPVRINAASWLADIRSTASEKALRARLKKEKSDPVRTALIVALERLGADLSDVIGPASLIAEAEKANAKAPPKLPEWLVANRLPQVRFKDGTSVPQAVVEYWLALAIRLKDPGAHGQFGIYLDQLDGDDARALSGWVLESWIAYDTTAASLEEATRYARSAYAGHYVYQNRRYVPGSQLPLAEQEQLIAQITRQKMGELVNSGSDTKGLLALACRADPVWAAGRVRWFLKKHGRRSNQAMALLE